MKMLMRNLKITLIVFLVISVSLLLGLSFQQYRSKNSLFVAAGENKKALKNRYAQAGTIYDKDGVILAQSVNGERVYCEDPEIAKALLQLVGDYTHNIGNTIESTYQGTLLGTDRNLFRQLLLDFQGKGLRGDNITLTLSGNLSKTAMNLLDGRSGSIVLINYKTGAVLASVSAPTVSPETVITYDKDNIPDTALFNRALQGKYAPGSTFKIVTATAFITSTLYDPGFALDCNRQSTVDPYGASESGDGAGHGHVDLSSAFADSCNVFFGQVGVNLGLEQILKTAKNMSYGESLSLDKLSVVTSKINSPDVPSTLSWLSIGQPVADSVLYMSPLQMAMLVGAIGNGGVMEKAHIIDHVTSPTGSVSNKLSVKPEKTIMDKATADTLKELMINVVNSGTGTAAAVNGRTVAAKTGTVQVEGQDNNNALCVAYIVEDDTPYAVAVIVEEGGSGGNTAAPLAGQMLGAAVG